MKVRFVAVALAALVVAPLTRACSIPGLREDFPFSPGSPVIEASLIRAITDWYVNLRDGPLGIAEVRIRAYSPKGSATAAKISQMRVAVVAQLIQTLGERDPVPLAIDMEAIESVRPASYDEVHIDVQPKCGSACCG